MATKNSLFVDTSGWALYLDRSDQLHQQVRAAYQRAVASKRGMVTSNYIIAELVALLDSRRHFPRQEIINFVDTLKAAPHIEIIHIDAALDAEAWAMLKSHTDKRWSLVDATSFVVMKRYGMSEVLTEDKHFVQAGFMRVPDQG